MKLLRPLVGYTLYDHKTNDYIRRELRIAGILDNTDDTKVVIYIKVKINHRPFPICLSGYYTIW